MLPKSLRHPDGNYGEAEEMLLLLLNSKEKDTDTELGGLDTVAVRLQERTEDLRQEQATVVLQERTGVQKVYRITEEQRKRDTIAQQQYHKGRTVADHH